MFGSLNVLYCWFWFVIVCICFGFYFIVCCDWVVVMVFSCIFDCLRLLDCCWVGCSNCCGYGLIVLFIKFIAIGNRLLFICGCTSLVGFEGLFVLMWVYWCIVACFVYCWFGVSVASLRVIGCCMAVICVACCLILCYGLCFRFAVCFSVMICLCLYC